VLSPYGLVNCQTCQIRPGRPFCDLSPAALQTFEAINFMVFSIGQFVILTALQQSHSHKPLNEMKGSVRMPTNSKGSRILLSLVLLLFPVVAFAADQADHQVTKSAPSVAAPSAKSSSPDASQYVGADTCKTCHEEIYNNWVRTEHWKTTLDTKAGPSHQGCEACHGPGAEHVAGGDKTKIFTFKDVSPEQINGRCLTCHQRYQEHANWSRGAHATNGVTCITCHSPHHAKARTLLVSATPGLCYGCHNEQKSDFSKPFRHRVNEGLVRCQDCHNVHGGYVLARSLRTTPQQDMVCYKCHSDKQGPFIFEHAPVRTEGCTSCHTPHGSVNARLLKTSQVNLLCLQCHTLSSTRITRSGSTDPNPVPGTPSFHDHRTNFFQACTLCHTSIHGSNGNAFFFR